MRRWLEFAAETDDAAGVAVGLLASLLFSQTLTSLLYDVTPFDLTTLAAVSVLLLAVAAAAALSPGSSREQRRSTRRPAH